MTGLARMLYYAPVSHKEDNTNWCGLHFDHGVFTALTSATFEKDGVLVKTPRKGGLYIRNTKIKIPIFCPRKIFLSNGK